MESFNTLYLLIFVICLGLSAFFSSAEIAFVSLSKLRVKHLVSTQIRGAERLERLLEQPGRYLAAILLGNNLANVAAAALGTIMAVAAVGPEWGALAATIGVTALLLVFGEVIPKTFAAHHAESMALIYTRPVGLIIRIFYPFVVALNHIGVGFTKMVAEEENRKLVSEDEIRTAITVGEAEGVWEESEAEILHKAFEFGDKPVREIMTQRTEVTWLERGIKLADFLEIYRRSPHSRFPIYKDNTDNVVGVLSIKDVLMSQADDPLGLDKERLIEELARPAYFAPETKLLGELLTEMRSNNYQMAIVVDEFGGIAGIATIEQLVEEIVGSIGDELAGGEREFITINANTFEVDGGLRVEEANEELGINLPLGEYETVAGFVLSSLGRIPEQGEHLKYRDLKLVILEMEGMKIERILITKESDATSAP